MASDTPLEVQFAELLEAKQMHQNSRPKIQKVAESIRNRKNFDKYFYSPRFVSIGPIHHDNPNLKLGENYKLSWAAKYIQSTQQSPEFLHKKIAGNIDELKGLYADDVLAESLKGSRSLDKKLSWLLFVDGCSLLYILENLRLYQHDKPKGGNTHDDQIGEREHVSIKVDNEAESHLNIKVDQLVLVMMDVLLLENQLPYLVLKLLWRNDNQNELIVTMKNYLKNYHWATPEKKTWAGIKERLPSPDNEETNEAPTHLLDLQRKMILKIEDKNEADEMEKKQSGINSEALTTYRNIQDLKTVGIKLISSRTRSPTDVDFLESWFGAKLTLPEIIVDDTTEVSFLNLIAYEMCPDFKTDYGICSYVVFMDSLIDHPEDVKELRSKGILLNSLGSDEEVTALFNVIGADLVLNPETYYEIKDKMHKHYHRKCNIWIIQSYHTWFITGFVTAFMALALTCVQTWFSIFPRGG
ncbi:UPF0481 protein At3g47200-like [Vicia villosa]|uniref:UPF0481 protein At3g47200-like n=1 Tax=Vicia villosa TaxID=3911 RepID=UPI00273C5C79|nr:UPF0481 protein At3g47200-like [Vicia villosa]